MHPRSLTINHESHNAGLQPIQPDLGYRLYAVGNTMILQSVITCPHCAMEKAELMPTDACRFFYTCTGCGATLRPKSGDCCVFCSYGSVPCPPIQAARSGHADSLAVLHRMTVVASDLTKTSRDWLRSPRTSALAWWVPQGAIVISLFLPVPLRTVIWIVALSWMGAACILNARRCGRTHCRYTGPYYLAMIAPVFGLSFLDADFLGWLVLAVIILAGSKLIWWATERAWGKFS